MDIPVDVVVVSASPSPFAHPPTAATTATAAAATAAAGAAAGAGIGAEVAGSFPLRAPPPAGHTWVPVSPWASLLPWLHLLCRARRLRPHGPEDMAVLRCLLDQGGVAIDGWGPMAVPAEAFSPRASEGIYYNTSFGPSFGSSFGSSMAPFLQASPRAPLSFPAWTPPFSLTTQSTPPLLVPPPLWAPPLHAALASRWLPALRLLLSRGADPASRDNHGFTALMRAVAPVADDVAARDDAAARDRAEYAAQRPGAWGPSSAGWYGPNSGSSIGNGGAGGAWVGGGLTFPAPESAAESAGGSHAAHYPYRGLGGSSIGAGAGAGAGAGGGVWGSSSSSSVVDGVWGGYGSGSGHGGSGSGSGYGTSSSSNGNGFPPNSLTIDAIRDSPPPNSWVSPARPPLSAAAAAAEELELLRALLVGARERYRKEAQGGTQSR